MSESWVIGLVMAGLLAVVGASSGWHTPALVGAIGLIALLAVWVLGK